MSDNRDTRGKSAEERFMEIREYFLTSLEMSGASRRELYYRPKPGDAREPTEEDVVRRWAESLSVPLAAIQAGITRGFEKAEELRQVVTSFRYCVPHIVNAAKEWTRPAPL